MGDAEPAGADPRDADGGGECAVCVCVHIRPLVAPELLEGCQECLSVTPGQPQARPCTRAQICALALVSSAEGPRVQVCAGPHSFTFDHVYGGGGGGASPELLYEECIQPLVAGLFAGFNATCLAYGQARRGASATSRARSARRPFCVQRGACERAHAPTPMPAGRSVNQRAPPGPRHAHAQQRRAHRLVSGPSAPACADRLGEDVHHGELLLAGRRAARRHTVRNGHHL